MKMRPNLYGVNILKQSDIFEFPESHRRATASCQIITFHFIKQGCHFSIEYFMAMSKI